MVQNKSEFSKWLTRAVAPLLRQKGYKRAGLVWERRDGAISDVVEFLVEFPPHVGAATFTIELGFFHPGVYEVLWQRQRPNSLTAVDCAVHFRVGRIMSDDFVRFLDKWWSLTDDAATAAIAETIVDVLSTRVCPFLEANHSLAGMREIAERLLESLQPADTLSLAVVCSLLGDREASNQILAEFLGRPNSAWFGRALKVKDALQ